MKNPFLWILLVLSVPVSAYMVFLGAVSISIGLQHRNEEGSWIPVLAGSLCILAVLWIFFRLSRSLIRSLKKSDSLSVH